MQEIYNSTNGVAWENVIIKGKSSFIVKNIKYPFVSAIITEINKDDFEANYELKIEIEIGNGKHRIMYWKFHSRQIAKAFASNLLRCRMEGDY